MSLPNTGLLSFSFCILKYFLKTITLHLLADDSKGAETSTVETLIKTSPELNKLLIAKLNSKKLQNIKNFSLKINWYNTYNRQYTMNRPQCL
jgi:hypothetical protein